MFRTKRIPWNKHKYMLKRRKNYFKYIGFVVVLLVISFLIGGLLKEYSEQEAVPAITEITVASDSQDNMGKIYKLLEIDTEDFIYLLSEGMPVLKNEEFSVRNKWDGLFHNLLIKITDLDPIFPHKIIGMELALPNAGEISYNNLSETNVNNDEGEPDFYLEYPELEPDWIPGNINELPNIEINGDTLVLLYNTHNAETYQPTDGKSKLEGKNAGVVTVAKYLAQSIEANHKIKTLRSEVIHDYPDWAKSYLNSMRTVTSLLKANPKIQTVIDIHRDAGLKSRKDTLVSINSKDAAKVMIVVGTEHPQYKKNLAFAQKIKAKADELYPGLIKEVRLRENRRYNQNLHPRAILLEFGSDLNKLEDATYSAQLLGDVIGKVLKGE